MFHEEIGTTVLAFLKWCVLSSSKMFSIIYCCPVRAANSVVISSVIMDTVGSGRFSYWSQWAALLSEAITLG